MVFILGLMEDQNPWHLKRAAIVYFAIGALHLLRAALILWVLARDSALRARQKPGLVQRYQSIWRRTWQTASESTVADAFLKQVMHVLARWGFLEAQGGFAKGFTIQGVAVVLSQTYQAYRCCNLVTRPWITSLYVAFVVSNCWAIPALCIYLRNRPHALVRPVILSVDAFLNMGSCFLFPLALFWPYYESFDTATNGFADADSYSSLW